MTSSLLCRWVCDCNHKELGVYKTSEQKMRCLISVSWIMGTCPALYFAEVLRPFRGVPIFMFHLSTCSQVIFHDFPVSFSSAIFGLPDNTRASAVVPASRVPGGPRGAVGESAPELPLQLPMESKTHPPPPTQNKKREVALDKMTSRVPWHCGGVPFVCSLGAFHFAALGRSLS